MGDDHQKEPVSEFTQWCQQRRAAFRHQKEHLESIRSKIDLAILPIIKSLQKLQRDLKIEFQPPQDATTRCEQELLELLQAIQEGKIFVRDQTEGGLDQLFYDLQHDQEEDPFLISLPSHLRLAIKEKLAPYEMDEFVTLCQPAQGDMKGYKGCDTEFVPTSLSEAHLESDKFKLQSELFSSFCRGYDLAFSSWVNWNDYFEDAEPENIEWPENDSSLASATLRRDVIVFYPNTLERRKA